MVAPHGAGLVNIIFSKKLTVVEIFGSSFIPCFFYLAKRLGFQYGLLRSKSPSREFHSWDGDIIVDIDKLKDLVSKMLDLSVKILEK